MPIRFRCENCDARVKVPDGSQGRRVRCPRCNHLQRVPMEVGSSSQEAAAAIVGERGPEAPASVDGPDAADAPGDGGARDDFAASDETIVGGATVGESEALAELASALPGAGEPPRRADEEDEEDEDEGDARDRDDAPREREAGLFAAAGEPSGGDEGTVAERDDPADEPGPIWSPAVPPTVGGPGDDGDLPMRPAPGRYEPSPPNNPLPPAAPPAPVAASGEPAADRDDEDEDALAEPAVDEPAAPVLPPPVTRPRGPAPPPPSIPLSRPRVEAEEGAPLPPPAVDAPELEETAAADEEDDGPAPRDEPAYERRSQPGALKLAPRHPSVPPPRERGRRAEPTRPHDGETSDMLDILAWVMRACGVLVFFVSLAYVVRAINRGAPIGDVITFTVLGVSAALAAWTIGEIASAVHAMGPSRR